MRDLLREKVDVEKFLHQESVLWYFVRSFSAESFILKSLVSFWWFLMSVDKLTSRCEFSSAEKTSPSLVDLKLHNCGDCIEPPRPAASMFYENKKIASNLPILMDSGTLRLNIWWWKIDHSQSETQSALKYSINWNNAMSISEARKVACSSESLNERTFFIIMLPPVSVKFCILRISQVCFPSPSNTNNLIILRWDMTRHLFRGKTEIKCEDKM